MVKYGKLSISRYDSRRNADDDHEKHGNGDHLNIHRDSVEDLGRYIMPRDKRNTQVPVHRPPQPHYILNVKGLVQIPGLPENLLGLGVSECFVPHHDVHHISWYYPEQGEDEERGSQ